LACDLKIQEIQQTAHAEVKQLKSQLNRLQEDSTESDRIFREILDQQEEEYEMELLKLKATSDGQLNQEQLRTQNGKGLIQSLNCKKNLLVRQNDELKSKSSSSEETFQRESELRRELQVSYAARQTTSILFVSLIPLIFVSTLQSEIQQLKTQIEEHEATIDIKSKDIQHLSTQNKSVTTIKHLLETQVHDLQKEKIPLKTTITDLEKEMNALSHNLSQQKKTVQAKELMIHQNEATIHSKVKLINKLEMDIRALKREFVILAGLEDDGEMNTKIDAAYRKYVTGEKPVR